MAQFTTCTWDGHDINDGTVYSAYIPNLYVQRDAEVRLAETDSTPPVGVITKPRERKLTLIIHINSGNLMTKRDELAKWLDTESKVLGRLVIQESGGASRYMMAYIETFTPLINQKQVAVTLIAPDGVWRGTALQSASKAMTAGDNSLSVTNNGTAIARPTYRITPTSQKTGSVWTYFRTITITNNLAKPLINYPLCITDSAGTGWDTTALVGAGKMQADGDDIRVWEAGVAKDYWFGAASGAAGGPNSSTTKIWCNLNFAANEVKTITITYGNAAATAYDADDDYKPIFNLQTSTNRLWKYTQFWDINGRRTGCWSRAFAPEPAEGEHHKYWVPRTEFGGGSWSDVDTANKMGIASDPTRVSHQQWVPKSSWVIYCPCIATQIVHSGATKLAADVVGKGKFRLATIDTNGVKTEQWSLATDTSGVMTAYGPITTVPTTVAEQIVFEIIQRSGWTWGGSWGWTWNGPATEQDGAYVSSCDVTLTTANTPTITSVDGATETATYDIAATIINSTRAEALDINLPGVGTSATLDINTEDRTCKIGQVSKITAITTPPRLEWLPLSPGANTIVYQETGMGNMTFEIQFEDIYS